MTSWLRIALAAQVLFFAAWGGRLLTSHRDGEVVWLATAPVDPRDLLSGHYVALSYPIATAASGTCAPPGEERTFGAEPVWIRLVPRGEVLATADGAAMVSEAAGCQTFPPDHVPGETWILGRMDPEHGRVAYGIERMFVGEDNPLRDARSGTVVAKVAINRDYEPRLMGLISRREPTALTPNAEN